MLPAREATQGAWRLRESQVVRYKGILAEGAKALSVTLSGGVLFAS